MTSKRRYIDRQTRMFLNEQEYCANNPNYPAPGCKGYICPLWNSPRSGKFDESGSEIDHIIEVSHGGTNDLINLQKLCPCCHAVKTKRCAKEKWSFNSSEIEAGIAHMEVDKKRKRRNSK